MFLYNRLRAATIGSAENQTEEDVDVQGKIDQIIEADNSNYPPIQPNGSLLLAWQVRNKRVLLVGGGNVAAGRIVNLLNADALVTVICPLEGLNPETAHYIKTHPSRIKYIPRNFQPSDVDDPSFVMALTAIDDPIESTRIYKLCKQKRIPVNIADVPPECDFYFGSIHRDGPLQIMVSTNGNGPRLAAMVRKRIASMLPDNTGAAIVRVGELRKKLRKMAPGTEQGPKRMEWMSKVCDDYTLDQLCEMTDGDMEVLLKGYEDNNVPAYEEIHNLAALMDSVELGEREDDIKDMKAGT